MRKNVDAMIPQYPKYSLMTLCVLEHAFVETSWSIIIQMIMAKVDSFTMMRKEPEKMRKSFVSITHIVQCGDKLKEEKIVLITLQKTNPLFFVGYQSGDLIIKIEMEAMKDNPGTSNKVAAVDKVYQV